MDKNEKTSFREAVFEIVRMIPPGRATSYGAVARACGYPLHSRMVGKIMASCGDADIPAHRVVNVRGELSGWSAFGCGNMQSLLESEGVEVRNNRIRNWVSIFWDPIDEIR